MLDNNKIIENPEIVKEDFEYQERMRKIKEEVAKRFQDYRTTMNYMACDAPLGVLCLPAAIENALIAHGIVRVYDLFNVDLTKIKGLGAIRIERLTSCLNQFLSML